MNRATIIDCTFNRLVVDIVREVFEPPVNPVASKRIGGSLNNSDVLLRHRLLQQPGGFEGGIPAGEETLFCDPSVMEPRKDRADLHSHLDRGAFGLPDQLVKGDHGLSSVVKLLQIQAEVVEVIRPLPAEAAKSVMTVILRVVGPFWDRVDDGLVGEERDRPLNSLLSRKRRLPA